MSLFSDEMLIQFGLIVTVLVISLLPVAFAGVVWEKVKLHFN